MHINQLPNDCFLHLYKKVSLSDLLIRIPRVCRRWKAIQTLSLRARLRVLLLVGERADDAHLHNRFPYTNSQFVTGQRPDEAKFLFTAELHGLKCAKLTPKSRNQLLTKLPNVRSLEVAQSHFSKLTLPQVYRLTSSAEWSNKLETLKLIFAWKPNKEVA